MIASQFFNSVAKIKEPELIKENISRASNIYANYRYEEGFAKSSAKLLTHPDENYKLAKGVTANFGLSLAPAKVSGVLNTCRWSTKGCRDLCINTSGNGIYPTTQKGRIVKTKFFYDHPEEFLLLLKHELNTIRTKMKLQNQKFAVRLNVFSDIPWEKIAPWLFTYFADIQFYDYTKYPERDNLPKNYHITYSASERDKDESIKQRLKNNQNVTIVADLIDQKVPTKWYSFKVIDGDKNDYRPADPKGVVVFLKPKGKAISKTKVPRGQFVRDNAGFNL